MPIDRKKFRSPNKLSSKRHLVQHINYREIEESMFRKPMTANRFDLLCRKLETRMFQEQSQPSEKIRVINFPVNEEKELHPTSPEKTTPANLREHKMRHTFANTFYLRNKIQKDRRESNSSLDCPFSEERPIDFREILSDENQKKLTEAKKRRSRIFSMVLRI